MTYQVGSWTVPASSTVPVFFVPPMCNVTFWNIGVQQVYLGTSAAVTAANGAQCHSIPTSFYTYATAKGTQLYATTGNATAGTIQYFIVTDQ
jgi:hypothetical protein